MREKWGKTAENRNRYPLDCLVCEPATMGRIVNAVGEMGTEALAS